MSQFETQDSLKLGFGFDVKFKLWHSTFLFSYFSHPLRNPIILMFFIQHLLPKIIATP
jgi:hypothetical protein